MCLLSFDENKALVHLFTYNSVDTYHKNWISRSAEGARAYSKSSTTIRLNIAVILNWLRGSESAFEQKVLNLMILGCTLKNWISRSAEGARAYLTSFTTTK